MDVVNLEESLILGHMPLVGTSYQSREKDEEYRRRFADASAMRIVIDAAIGMGVRRFAAASPSSSPLSPLHIRVLRHTVDEGHDIELIPCVEIPIKLRDQNINAFRRWATYLTIESKLYPEVKQRILDDPILHFREGWKQKLPNSKPYDTDDFKRLTIDWNKIEDDLEHFVDLPISHMEPGSETDFLTMTGRFDLIGELIDRIKERGFNGALLGVHHAGVTIQRLDEELRHINGYVTPLNPIGVMMFPTKTSAEKAIIGTKRAVYAIKPMAGGRVKPKRAFTYVFNFNIEGCMIGAASVAEVKEDFKAAIEVLKSHGNVRI